MSVRRAAELNLFLRQRMPDADPAAEAPLNALCRELRELVDELAARRLNVTAALGLLAAQFDPAPAFPATGAIETLAGLIVEEAARISQTLRRWPLRAWDPHTAARALLPMIESRAYTVLTVLRLFRGALPQPNAYEQQHLDYYAVRFG